MKKVVTHNGRFHSDEALACAVLDLVFDGIEIIRTRDFDQITKHNRQGAIVVDVGGVYDPHQNLFDHHQSNFNQSYNSYSQKLGVPLSSCGLVYRHYWESLLAPYLDKYNYHPTPQQLSELRDSIYFSCILEFDAGDNGVEIQKYIGDQKVYLSSNLIGMVSSMNRDSSNHSRQLRQFMKSVKILKKYLATMVDSRVSRKASFDRVSSRIKSKIGEPPYESILIFEDDVKEYGNIGTLKDTLRYLDTQNKILFLIIPNKEVYRIYTMSGNSGRFSQRAKLISKEKAQDLVGDRLEFIHPVGFTGGCKDRESAIRVARVSLERHLQEVAKIFHSSSDSDYNLVYKVVSWTVFLGGVGLLGWWSRKN